MCLMHLLNIFWKSIAFLWHFFLYHLFFIYFKISCTLKLNCKIYLASAIYAFVPHILEFTFEACLYVSCVYNCMIYFRLCFWLDRVQRSLLFFTDNEQSRGLMPRLTICALIFKVFNSIIMKRLPNLIVVDYLSCYMNYQIKIIQHR